GVRCLFRREPVQPQGGLAIAGHAPIAAWRQADRAHFGPVRQTGALELIVEEAPEEDRQPMADALGGIGDVKAGLSGKKENLFWRRAIAKEMEQKEIMQFVGPDQFLGDVDNLAILAGRQQLG